MDEEFNPIEYMRNYINSFRQNNPDIVTYKPGSIKLRATLLAHPSIKKQYNIYLNYLLALSHISSIRDIASSEGYDCDIFPLDFLNEVDHEYLEAVLNEEEAPAFKIYQKEEADKLEKQKILRRKRNN